MLLPTTRCWSAALGSNPAAIFVFPPLSSRPPSQEGSNGGAGRPDGAVVGRRSEEGRRVDAAAGQAARASVPALRVGGVSGSEGEHTHQ